MLTSTSATSDVNPVPEVLIPIIEAIKVEEKEPEPALIMTTRYSVGTQTEFIDGKSLNIGDENETEQTQLSTKEKFRKTLRLSNEAIVSTLFTFPNVMCYKMCLWLIMTL